MTEVHQAEQTKTKTRKRAQQPDFIINYDEAVALAKQLVKDIKSDQMRLGELADRLQPKYGDKTLARFAKDIRVNVATVERWRSVYRKWKGKAAPGPLSATVLKIIASHPQREKLAKELVKLVPEQRKRMAEIYMRDYRAGQGQEEPEQEEAQAQDQNQEQAQEEEAPQPQEPSLVIEMRRWITGPWTLARMAIRSQCGHVTPQYLDPAIIRAALTTAELGGPEQVEATLRAGGEELITLADKLKGAPPIFNEAASGDATSD